MKNTFHSKFLGKKLRKLLTSSLAMIAIAVGLKNLATAVELRPLVQHCTHQT